MRVRGKKYIISSQLVNHFLSKLHQEGRVVSKVDGVVMRGLGVGDVREIEGDGLVMFIVKGM